VLYQYILAPHMDVRLIFDYR